MSFVVFGNLISLLLKSISVESQVLARLGLYNDSLDFLQSIKRVFRGKLVQLLQKTFLEFQGINRGILFKTQVPLKLDQIIWKEEKDCQNPTLFGVPINEHVLDFSIESLIDNLKLLRSNILSLRELKNVLLSINQFQFIRPRNNLNNVASFEPSIISKSLLGLLRKLKVSLDDIYPLDPKLSSWGQSPIDSILMTVAHLRNVDQFELIVTKRTSDGLLVQLVQSRSELNPESLCLPIAIDHW